ncbi:ATP-dependent DNA helicase PIF4-like [Elysia marginata]|uniref:ATP-dependent DNA helicase n=1 Tax=Elysia marginata TaxID=1093978 RepID=A0AAV4GXL1_9GAST|nr:ATP-dependent DNA helicase PIF4-like [Elysia marginata]
MKAVFSNALDKQRLFFIDGPGGCGKTFLYNTILSYVRGKQLEAIAVASSGIAAELLDGGRTAHSKVKIPIPIEDHSTCKISRKSELGGQLKNARLIVWDEAPMMDRRVFECVSRTLCDLE